MRHARRKFDYCLKEYQREGDARKKWKEKVKARKDGMVDGHFLKVMRKRQKDVE